MPNPIQIAAKLYDCRDAMKNLFQKHDTLEEEALALVEMDPSHRLFDFRLNRLRAIVDPDNWEEDE